MSGVVSYASRGETNKGLSYDEIVAGPTGDFGQCVCRARRDEDDVGPTPKFDV